MAKKKDSIVLQGEDQRRDGGSRRGTQDTHNRTAQARAGASTMKHCRKCHAAISSDKEIEVDGCYYHKNCVPNQGGKMNTFEKELTALINRYSEENGSNTPDFILALYLVECLRTFNTTMTSRAQWYGEVHIPGKGRIPIRPDEEINDLHG